MAERHHYEKKIRAMWLFILTLALVNSLGAQPIALPFPTENEFHIIDLKGSPHVAKQNGSTCVAIYQDLWLTIITPKEITFDRATNAWSNARNKKCPLILFIQGTNETSLNDHDHWPLQIYKDSVGLDSVGTLLKRLGELLPIDLDRIYVHELSSHSTWTSDFLISHSNAITSLFPDFALMRISKKGSIANYTEESQPIEAPTEEPTPATVTTSVWSLPSSATKNPNVFFSNYKKTYPLSGSQNDYKNYCEVLCYTTYSGIEIGKNYSLNDRNTGEKKGRIEYYQQRQFKIFDLNNTPIGVVEINKSGTKYTVYDRYGYKTTKSRGMSPALIWGEVILGASLIWVSVNVMAAN